MKPIAALLLLITLVLALLARAQDDHSTPAPMLDIADAIIIKKAARTLTLLKGGTPLKNYSVALGFEPSGHKQQEGDGRTPEGSYSISGRNPRSQFHLSLRISYPNRADRERAAKRGVSAGSDIMIHGLPNGAGAIGAAHLLRDWTAGCIAVTSEEIEEIYASVANGTPVEILP